MTLFNLALLALALRVLMGMLELGSAQEKMAHSRNFLQLRRSRRLGPHHGGER